MSQINLLYSFSFYSVLNAFVQFPVIMFYLLSYTGTAGHANAMLGAAYSPQMAAISSPNPLERASQPVTSMAGKSTVREVSCQCHSWSCDSDNYIYVVDKYKLSVTKSSTSSNKHSFNYISYCAGGFCNYTLHNIINYIAWQYIRYY